VGLIRSSNSAASVVVGAAFDVGRGDRFAALRLGLGAVRCFGFGWSSRGPSFLGGHFAEREKILRRALNPTIRESSRAASSETREKQGEPTSPAAWSSRARSAIPLVSAGLRRFGRFRGSRSAAAGSLVVGRATAGRPCPRHVRPSRRLHVPRYRLPHPYGFRLVVRHSGEDGKVAIHYFRGFIPHLRGDRGHTYRKSFDCNGLRGSTLPRYDPHLGPKPLLVATAVFFTQKPVVTWVGLRPR
jgi:hypothetical protein